MASDQENKAQLRILCIGECMVELSPAGPGLYRQDFAGDSYNTAVYLARQFAPRLSVSYLTALGVAGFSLTMQERFASEGLDVSHIRIKQGAEPGLYLINNDEEGERFFQYWRGQSAARQMFAGQTCDGLVEEFAQFDALYLTGISLAILDDTQRGVLFAALEKIKTQRLAQICFDPNFRPALWPDRTLARNVVRQMASLCSIALVTLDDHVALFESDGDAEGIAMSWQGWGAREVVIKHGSSQCLVTTGDQRLTIAPPQSLKPVDTTGAGDSFAAGYVGARLEGLAPAKAAEIAHKIAAQVIMHPGGVIARDVWNRISD